MLAYTLRRLPDGAIALSLRGDVAPPGGIVLRPPLPGPLVSVEVDGRAHAFDPAGITLRTSPADVVLRC
jgi:hypothetical protein